MRFRVEADPDTEQWWHLWRWRDLRTDTLSTHQYAFRFTAWLGGLFGTLL